VWLGLSQLHTLHDVDLKKVSVAAIAAALPRLHTLYALGELADSSVAGFFTDLLPRLRVFRFRGVWPVVAAESAPPTAPPWLPRLEELKWDDLDRPQQMVFRGFFGAQPRVLAVPYKLIAECLTDRGDFSDLLARVRDLRVRCSFVGVRRDVSAAAQVLPAAPHLHTFTMCVFDDSSWRTASAARLVRAFVGLAHRRLRCFAVRTREFSDDTVSLETSSSPDGCASRLRQTCFPRLRELRVDEKILFTT
jgi:hypothetical protein